jgi:hypothetical protein
MQSVVALMFAAMVTALFIFVGWADSFAYVDVAMFLLLAFFIGLGHRWAMMAAMILWTFEMGDRVFETFANHQSTGRVVSGLIFWCLFMHAFYFSFRIEQERKKRAAAEASRPAGASSSE